MRSRNRGRRGWKSAYSVSASRVGLGEHSESWKLNSDHSLVSLFWMSRNQTDMGDDLSSVLSPEVACASRRGQVGSELRKG